MKHRWLWRGLILLTALGLCFGMVLYSRERPQPKAKGLTLWYAENDCSPAAMDMLLARCLKETGLQIEATAFPDEISLGEAFENAMPDLLFCSHIRAAQLDGRGSLTAIPTALPAPESMSEIHPEAGSSFFPIGSRLPVLLVNTSLTGSSFDSMDSMLAAAETPTLVIDRCSEFLYAQAAAAGAQLSGIPDQDLKDAAVIPVYNEMALAVFRGTLVIRENPAEYVRQGLVPAAVAVSSALAGISDKGLEVQLLPLPEGAKARYPVELMGFALLDGADRDTAEDFFKWFWNERSAEMALKAGLAPVMRASTDSRSGSSFEKLLSSLENSGMLYFLDADEPFVRNREICEDWLRETLDLIA